MSGARLRAGSNENEGASLLRKADTFVTGKDFTMALSPTAAIQSRDTKRNEQIAALETSIDQFLAANFETNQCIFDVPAGTKKSTYDEVVNRYRNAGWIVEERIDFHNNRQIVLQSPA